MSEPGGYVIGLVATLVRLFSFLILLDVIASWAWMLGVKGAAPYAPWVRTLRSVTDPVLAPIRRIIPPRNLQGLDISPILAILILQFVAEALASAAG
jgi:YggT family protein